MVAGGDVLLTLEEGLTWVCNCTKSRSDARVTAFDLSDATRIVRSHATSRRSRCDLVAISRDLVAIWSRSRGDLSDFRGTCRDASPRDLARLAAVTAGDGEAAVLPSWRTPRGGAQGCGSGESAPL